MPTHWRDLIPYLMTYKGGSTAACGTTTTQITVPAGSHTAWIHAEGGAIYYGINTGTATTLSAGYIPQDMHGIVPEIDNLTTLHVIGSGTAAIAHVEFYEA